MMGLPRTLAQNGCFFVSFRWLKRVASCLAIFGLVVAIVFLLLPGKYKKEGYSVKDTKTGIHLLMQHGFYNSNSTVVWSNTRNYESHLRNSASIEKTFKEIFWSSRWGHSLQEVKPEMSGNVDKNRERITKIWIELPTIWNDHWGRLERFLLSQHYDCSAWKERQKK